MGGTQFNGLALVHELVRQGHDVTIVNRGRTEAPLPDRLNRLYADRTDHDQMRDVLGGLEFDAVYDISGYHPDDVALMMELFEGRTGRYVFASSTVVYAASNHLPITEDHPVEVEVHRAGADGASPREDLPLLDAGAAVGLRLRPVVRQFHLQLS